MNRILGKHPLGLGEPQDAAKAALFLLSDASMLDNRQYSYSRWRIFH